MAIFDEDLPKKSGPEYRIGQDLSALSVDELVETVEGLKAEIDRLEQEIVRKKATLSDADSFFKS